jgi:hypothetical protein
MMKTVINYGLLYPVHATEDDGWEREVSRLTKFVANKE